MKYKHLMIDIETLGNQPGSTIVSIAALPFDISGPVGESFFKHINLDDALKYGSPSADTLIWWNTQDQTMLNKLLSEGNVTTDEAISDLAYYCKSVMKEDFIIWANGPDFDLKMIEDKMMKLNIQKFWLPWNQRCVRTIKAIDQSLAKSFTNPEKHNPIEDCIIQIKQVLAINEKYDLKLI